jgi:hypothetical protein
MPRLPILNMDAKAFNFGPAGSGLPHVYRGQAASGQPKAREAASALASISGWQSERSRTLQKLCKRIKARVDDGQPLLKAVRRATLRLNGKPYHCDPQRRWALSPATLYRLWYCWCRGGEIPSAFKLHYAGGRKKTLTLAVLSHFVCFCATYQFHSQKKAWAAFAKAEDRHWSHRRSGRPSLAHRFSIVPIYFQGLKFKELQAGLKAIAANQKELNRLRIIFIADMARRFPAPAARRRRTALGFDI